MTEYRAPPALNPRTHALFLDFDGTLVDFAPVPDAIVIRPGTIELLEDASRKLGGALALVSGRRVEDIDRYLAPLRLPASGVHGQEFRPDPTDFNRIPPPDDLDVARHRLTAAMGPADPILLEDKGGALVLHYRTHRDQRRRAEALARYAAHGLDGLRVFNGHAVFEVLERGVTKARALRLFAERPAFAHRIPVFVGDDTTDEDGLRAAAEAGGFGVKVGPGPSEAVYRLPNVTAVHDWLAALAEPVALPGTLASARR